MKFTRKRYKSLFHYLIEETTFIVMNENNEEIEIMLNKLKKALKKAENYPHEKIGNANKYDIIVRLKDAIEKLEKQLIK